MQFQHEFIQSHCDMTKGNALDVEIAQGEATLLQIWAQRLNKKRGEVKKPHDFDLQTLQEQLENVKLSTVAEGGSKKCAMAAAMPPPAHHQRQRRMKSGILAKPCDNVLEPQLWAHSALQGKYLHTSPAFNSLQFHELVAGELEIVDRLPEGSKQRSVRLNILRKLAYLHASHDLEDVRVVYGGIISSIENGALSWSSSHIELDIAIQGILLNRNKFHSRDDTSSEGDTETGSDSDE